MSDPNPMGLANRFGLLNHKYLHYGVASTTVNWAAGVDGPACVILAAAAGLTITLPPAADSLGAAFYIKRTVTGGAVTIAPSGADLIDGASSKSLPNQFDSILVVCDGVTSWWILAEFPQPL